MRQLTWWVAEDIEALVLGCQTLEVHLTARFPHTVVAHGFEGLDRAERGHVDDAAVSRRESTQELCCQRRHVVQVQRQIPVYQTNEIVKNFYCLMMKTLVKFNLQYKMLSYAGWKLLLSTDLWQIVLLCYIQWAIVCNILTGNHLRPLCGSLSLECCSHWTADVYFSSI